MDAFARELVELRPFIFRYLKKLLSGSQEVEDLVQDVFVRALTKQSQYIPTLPLQAWVRTIALNLVRDQYRSRMNDERRLDGHPPIPEGVSGGQHERHELQDVFAALERFPKSQQIALIAMLDGSSYEEIGRRHGMPMNTVKSCVRRGRAALQQELGSADA